MWCTKINQSIRSKQPRIWERDNIIRKNSPFFLAHWKYFLSWRGEEIKLDEDDNLFEVAAWPQKEKMWFLQKCKCSVFKAFCDVFLQTSVLENRKMAKQNQTLPLLGYFLFGDSLTLLLFFLNFQCTPVQVCCVFVSEYHTVVFRSPFMGVCTASWWGTIVF